MDIVLVGLYQVASQDGGEVIWHVLSFSLSKDGCQSCGCYLKTSIFLLYLFFVKKEIVSFLEEK